jgi:outer membrane protein assembly factor BamA
VWLSSKRWRWWNSLDGCPDRIGHISGHWGAGVWRLLVTVLVAATALAARAESVQQSPAAPTGVNYEGQAVSSVDMVARPGEDLDALRALLVQRGGEPYSNAKVQASIDSLRQTGRFGKIDVQVTPEPAGLHLAFVLQPAYYVGVVTFLGADKRFNYGRLLQVVNFPDQEPFDETQVSEARKSLLDFFQQQGYFEAQVRTETQVDDPNRLVNIAYQVALGRHAKFGPATVKGPPAPEAARLEGVLRSFRARLKGDSIRAGRPYDPGRVQSATTYLVNYLSKQQRLANQVKVEPVHYDPETNRASVAFDVDLGPLVSVKVTGARLTKLPFSEHRTMVTLLPVFQENSVDQDLIDEGSRNLVNYFQKKGFFDVKVDDAVNRTADRIDIVYTISKGKKHKVSDIDFTGNRHFSSSELLSHVSLKKGGMLSHGSFSQKLVTQDEKNLDAFYRNAGFAEVKVSSKVVDREPRVGITFDIDEGPETIVNSFRLEGNKTQSQAALAPEGLEVAGGKPYSQYKLDQDRNHILASYLDLGYLVAQFKSSVTPVGGDKHRVDVVYAVEEGPRVYISNVVYVGQDKTNLNFLKERAQLDPGAPLSQGDLLKSESTLYDLGIFDWASVAPRAPVTTQTSEPALVKVHESKRNSLTYGFGFQLARRGGNVPSGTVALPGLPVVGIPNNYTTSEQTFWGPSGDIEYTRRNLRGRDETGTISLLGERLDQRALLTYADPYFHGTNWSSLFSFTIEHNSQNPIYISDTGQVSYQVQRWLDQRKTKSLLFRYSFERTNLSNLSIPGLVPPQDERVRLSTFGTSYVRDTRDKPLDAHHGIYQTLDFGVTPRAIGSSSDFVRFLGQTAYYRPVKKTVWANRVQLGLAKPWGMIPGCTEATPDNNYCKNDVPLSQKFFTGGASTLRGFPINGAGPQRTVPVCSDPADPATCSKITVPEGGNQLFIVNSELRFPLGIRPELGAAVFYDGGNVYPRISLGPVFRDYTNTVGFGIRYNTPIGPVRLDVGQLLEPIPGIRSTQFFVTLGQAF